MIQKKKFTIGEIIQELEKNPMYTNRFKVYDTFLRQEDIRWRRGKRATYERQLAEAGLQYFAFIKFYLNENNEKIGLVAGKSGSINVNVRSDLNFSRNPKYGEAKAWLYKNNLQWSQTEVLIISTLSKEKVASRKEAFEIERFLMREFNLLGG